jgi:hypothetical protein
VAQPLTFQLVCRQLLLVYAVNKNDFGHGKPVSGELLARLLAFRLQDCWLQAEISRSATTITNDMPQNVNFAIKANVGYEFS